MLVFWQECKYILRSCFLWAVMMLGIFVYGFFIYNNFGFSQDLLNASFLYTQENGKTFSTREDAESYIKLYLQNTETGKLLADALEKAGLEDIVDRPVDEIMDYRNTPEIREKLDKLVDSDSSSLSMIYMYLQNIQTPIQMVESSANDIAYEENPEEEKAYWEAIMIPKIMSEWKKELLMEEGYENR